MRNEPTTNGSPRAAAAPALRVADVTVAYRGDPAIERISFDVRLGERVAVIGPNGAGKSTLFKAMLGLLQFQSGRVDYLGVSPLHVGYVPQHQEVNWDFPVTVRDVVMMGRVRHIGWLRFPTRDQWHTVDVALDRVGLFNLRDRQIGELSGGQRRRVFIARALAQDARLLVLDEPFSGVDASAQASLIETLDSLNADGLTLLLSTHDLDLAFRRFDRVLALRRTLIAFGTPEQVYTPETLTQMYGGALAITQDGRQVSLFVDEHKCTEEC